MFRFNCNGDERRNVGEARLGEERDICVVTYFVVDLFSLDKLPIQLPCTFHLAL
jgi:hypothetical protein